MGRLRPCLSAHPGGRWPVAKRPYENLSSLSKLMKLIVDAETWLFRAAAASAVDHEISDGMWTHLTDLAAAKDSFVAEMEALQAVAPDHEMTLAMGDKVNFRHQVFPDYKANRRTQRKPAGYSALKDWLEQQYTVVRLENVEADDVCGIVYEQGDIIASRDKDLRTIPGLHLQNGQINQVGEWEANVTFFMQVLMGDATDGYPGLKGVGPKTAAKLLAGAATELEMWQAVSTAYAKAGHEPSYPLQMARCARILRPGEYDLERRTPQFWSPPVA